MRSIYNKKESVSVNGVKIELFYNVFKIYNLLEKFETPFEAEENFRKSKGVLGFENAFSSIKTEAKDVTKEFLKKVKSITSRGNSVNINMEKNKIFISHSSEDKGIVEAFVDEILKQGFEIPQKKIFCSSIEGMGVKNGAYIPDVIKKELHQSQLVFLFISENYKNSEVCLNELGAAWVLLEKENVIPLILPDCGFDKLGFLDYGRLGTKLDDQDKMGVLIDDVSKIIDYQIEYSSINKYLKKFNNTLKGTFIKHKDKEISDHEMCYDLSLPE